LTLSSVFEHQISGQSQYIPPRISAGGILADVMGLGKTLTVLSAIVHSMDEACHFTLPSGETPVDDHLAYSTQATLVVVPSARKCPCVPSKNDWRRLILPELIEVWKSEIAR
jgi:SNF2 family DNA or RNA helicase